MARPVDISEVNDGDGCGTVLTGFSGERDLRKENPAKIIRNRRIRDRIYFFIFIILA